jgi:DNA polymerase-3 subunit alpha
MGDRQRSWRGGSSIRSTRPCLEQRAKREKRLGQNGLFGAMPEEIDYANELSPTLKGWTSSEMLAAEKAALGFYITGHPLERYLETLQT